MWDKGADEFSVFLDTYFLGSWFSCSTYPPQPNTVPYKYRTVPSRNHDSAYKAALINVLPRQTPCISVPYHAYYMRSQINKYSTVGSPFPQNVRLTHLPAVLRRGAR